MKNKEILQKLRSVELCLTAHPDFEKGSEFEDRIFDLQAIQKALTLKGVNTRKLPLWVRPLIAIAVMSLATLYILYKIFYVC